MVKLSSRGKKKQTKRRIFPGEEEAQGLLGLINGGRMIDRELLKRLVTALQAAGQVRPGTIKRWPSCDADAGVKAAALQKTVSAVKAEAELLKPVNAIVHSRGYLAFPTVQPGPSIVWRCTPESATAKGQTKGAADVELHGALAAVSLAKEGRIGHLKPCKKCPRWFFARFEHQKFCSQSCKDGSHRDDPAEKEKRAARAKKKYWLHKKHERQVRKSNVDF